MPVKDEVAMKSCVKKLKEETSGSSRCSSQCGISGNAEALAKVGEFKRQAEELAQKMNEMFESQFGEIIEKIAMDMEQPKLKKSRHANEYDEDGLKIFVARESLLTELLEINHIQTIYNVFIALLLVFLMNTALYDFLETGRLIDFSVVSWAFGNFSSVIQNWLYMQAYTLAIYPIFTSYASNQTSWAKIPMSVWSVGYIAYMLIFLTFPVQGALSDNLPPASTIILITEQVRLMMKVHAFVRVNTTKVLKFAEIEKDDDDISELKLPGFSQYLYFLFIPTLIYRDNYPMTPYVRWDFVVKNFLQVLGCIAYTYFMFARFCVPVFQNTGKEKGNIRTLLLSAFSCMLPGVLVLLVAFFAILHSWLNAFAEMTRFADRMFYRDWWNSNSFSSYYRMWNVVVHDWLYAYIYKDFNYLFGRRGRGFAAILVFFISACFHEYILAVAFRFFYPALLFMFGGVGLVFFFVRPKKGSNNPLWNIYLWVSLTMGSGILMTMYSVEWYASQNCTRDFNSWLDFIIPYSFDSTCVVWEWKK
ncbi:sterol O-acyltransferase 1-like [Hydractinia symbiolongicarpus]|uniref:sterol O-acyltransferase 1-like n=1 Tax=Hydractinia symbiolongicarpus TaxID=13093 RepID=UPI00254A8ABD|nr:sterol O-acyltransferase 1-like [Hydractinia symbiolongicarpus]XP_057293029.1 sterol O-acyltransferase 1-like [Hydractinia symbiolongicarpus]